jgi:hypothetical protein
MHLPYIQRIRSPCLWSCCVSTCHNAHQQALIGSVSPRVQSNGFEAALGTSLRLKTHTFIWDYAKHVLKHVHAADAQHSHLSKVRLTVQI